MNLKIVTPAGTIVNTQVSEVALVSAEGSIEILPGHATYTGLLKTGLLTYEANGEKVNLVTESGFVQVSDEEVTVLTTVAQTKDKIDPKSYAKNRDVYTKQLASLDTTERQLAKMELDKINAIDQMLQIN